MWFSHRSFTKAIEQASAGRQQHAGATADLRAVAAEIVALVERINALNRHRFRGDPDLLAAWDSARNVFGPIKRSTGPPASEPPPNPPPVTPPADADRAA